MNAPSSRVTLLVCSTVIAAAVAMVSAADSDLAVTKVQADAGTTQITITVVDPDDHLRGLPGVSLAGTRLVIVSATVAPGRRPSTGTIVAKLPAPIAGATYELVVDWGHDSNSNTEITLGAQGPQGPQGIPGLNGANGAPGPQGPAGPIGP